ncbi:MAG: hypothetical protein V4615_01515 [Bacteroidota bacterium]
MEKRNSAAAKFINRCAKIVLKSAGLGLYFYQFFSEAPQNRLKENLPPVATNTPRILKQRHDTLEVSFTEKATFELLKNNT